jgi:hypothetical protein
MSSCLDSVIILRSLLSKLALRLDSLPRCCLHALITTCICIHLVLLNHYVVTQTGTSDTCSATGEELVFGHMLDKSLITLGWIHTHPKVSDRRTLTDLTLHRLTTEVCTVPLGLCFQ